MLAADEAYFKIHGYPLFSFVLFTSLFRVQRLTMTAQLPHARPLARAQGPEHPHLREVLQAHGQDQPVARDGDRCHRW